MNRIIVDFDNSQNNVSSTKSEAKVPDFAGYETQKKTGKLAKILKIIGISLVLFGLIFAVGGYFYWQKLKSTPQYSLALLIEAVRQNDQKSIEKLIDTDAIVDDFIPQITAQAVELYGRGLPPETIAKAEKAAMPLVPEIKKRARNEVPKLIKDKTKKFENVPFWAIALGAEKMLEIRQDKDKAFVKSSLQEHPLEVTMKTNGSNWQIIGVKDEILSRRIAEKVGQEILAATEKKGLIQTGKQFGVENLQEILTEFEIGK